MNKNWVYILIFLFLPSTLLVARDSAKNPTKNSAESHLKSLSTIDHSIRNMMGYSLIGSGSIGIAHSLINNNAFFLPSLSLATVGFLTNSIFETPVEKVYKDLQIYNGKEKEHRASIQLKEMSDHVKFGRHLVISAFLTETVRNVCSPSFSKSNQTQQSALINLSLTVLFLYFQFPAEKAYSEYLLNKEYEF